MNLLSLFRLGLDLGLFPGVPRALVEELFLVTQPAHLQFSRTEKLSPEERDLYRADMVRQALRSVPRPVPPSAAGATSLDKPPSS
jgi:protein arginine kinase